MEVGDYCLLWQNGAKQGFYGMGIVSSGVFEHEEVPPYRSNHDSTLAHWVRLVRIFDEPIEREKLSGLQQELEESWGDEKERWITYWSHATYRFSPGEWSLLREHFPELVIDEGFEEALVRLHGAAFEARDPKCLLDDSTLVGQFMKDEKWDLLGWTGTIWVLKVGDLLKLEEHERLLGKVDRVDGSILPRGQWRRLISESPDVGDLVAFRKDDRLIHVGVVQRVGDGVEINILTSGLESEGSFQSGLMAGDVQPVKREEDRELVLSMLRKAERAGRSVEDALQNARSSGRPQNIILYGPPGTGKTFSTTRRSLDLCGVTGPYERDDRGARKLFERLREQRQIGFVTFHQSYGYEEFVEGIRPEITQSRKKGSTEGDGGEIHYEYKDGIFKRIALLAASHGCEGLNPELMEFRHVWAALKKAIREDTFQPAESAQGLAFRRAVKDDGVLEYRRQGEAGADGGDGARYELRRDLIEFLWKKREELGDPTRTDLDRVIGEKFPSRPMRQTAAWMAFQDLRAIEAKNSRREQGIAIPTEFRIAAARAALQESDPDFDFRGAPSYVLVVDEINRGNISKIFGELITLLEPEKRLGASESLIVELPYSQQRFGVPPNLHIIGTMNTADRSIALMDVALRRRFNFDEMMPDPGVVTDVLPGKVDEAELPGRVNCDQWVRLVRGVMKSINARIRFLYDREHQLGHSYFLKATSPDKLRKALVDEVIPLLQEYFYGSWERVCIALGCPWIRGKARRGQKRGDEFCGISGEEYDYPVIQCQKVVEKQVLGFDHDDYENQFEYRVHPDLLERDDGRAGKDTQRPVSDERLMNYFRTILSREEYDGESLENVFQASLGANNQEPPEGLDEPSQPEAEFEV